MLHLALTPPVDSGECGSQREVGMGHPCQPYETTSPRLIVCPALKVFPLAYTPQELIS